MGKTKSSTVDLEGRALAKTVLLDVLSSSVTLDGCYKLCDIYVESNAEFKAAKKEVKRLLKVLHAALRRGERVPVLVRNS